MAKKAGGNPNTGLAILAACGGIMLMMLAWRFPVPLPHIAPHPTTLLSLIAVLLGIWLGPKRGTLIVAFYVLAVILDLPPLIWRMPVADTPFLSLPVNGLVFGLIVASLVAGLLTLNGPQSHPVRIGLAVLLGHLAYLAIGIAWLARFTPLSHAASVMLQSQLAALLVKSAAAFLITILAARFARR